MPSPLETISPLDGRYASQVNELAHIFSEMGLMQKRLMVEIEYLIALGEEKGVKEVPRFDDKQKKILRNVYQDFLLKDAEEVKKIEKTTDHDVKAIEYFIKEKLRKPPLSPLLTKEGMGRSLLEFVHFTLTSEDVNNLAYSLMWQEGVKLYINQLNKLINVIKGIAKSNKNQPMLSLTHGQSASPTTLGKEFAVFCFRLEKQRTELERIKLTGKFSGTVGNWHAHTVAYPNVNWINFSERLIGSLGLAFNPLTTQIEPHDTLAQSLDALKRLNTILVNLCQDMWLYISRGIFKQQVKKGEVGSSTMPHKVNPIKFENAESNAALANTLLEHLARALPISRMQRDLRDSSLMRNQGVVLGHSLLAVKNALAGLARVAPNKEQLKKELDDHWEVLAEPIQTVLRKVGFPKPYEKLKELTRGQQIKKEVIKRTFFK
jgi:adenylosuccinate lyase